VIPQLRAGALSDIGRLRLDNQDRCLFDEDLGLFGVADGVGGLPGGAAAAETAATAVTDTLRALQAEREPDLAAVVAEANRRVCEIGRQLSPVLGIASTLTFACRRGHRLAIAHVGDSRCYRWHAGKLHCLTEDHSVENEARKRGEACPPDHRQALVQCVGQLPAPVPDVTVRSLVRGERYLFCTDGVSGLMSDGEIGSILGRDGTPAELLQQLVSLALRRGGPDNASGVLVFVDEA